MYWHWHLAAKFRAYTTSKAGEDIPFTEYVKSAKNMVDHAFTFLQANWKT